MSNWPHAPHHAFNQKGTYMVTGATLHKELFFKSEDELDLLQNTLLKLASQYQWKLEAWSLFPNHYHFIAHSPFDPTTLKKLITHFHAASSRELNKSHQTLGRKIWYQYWDTQLTFQASYLARLNYVMQNPVKHGIVTCAKEYKWCSAAWFAANAEKSHYRTVIQFKTDNLTVLDDF